MPCQQSRASRHTRLPSSDQEERMVAAPCFIQHIEQLITTISTLQQPLVASRAPITADKAPAAAKAAAQQAAAAAATSPASVLEVAVSDACSARQVAPGAGSAAAEGRAVTDAAPALRGEALDGSSGAEARQHVQQQLERLTEAFRAACLQASCETGSGVQ